MATLASVQIRSSGKLPHMLVTVAISATLKLDFKQRVFAFGDMAAFALNRGMFALQRVGGRRVFLDCELARLEPLDGVAGRTLTLVDPRRELTIVRVRLVTVHAPLECK